MAAVELYRAISNWNDLGLGDYNLHYIRNKEKEEVDFLMTNHRKPLLLIETKLSETDIPKSLIKFQSALNVPAVQLVNKPDVYKIISNQKNRILVISATRRESLLP